MNLPFSPDEFFAVFERYNQSVWPAQIVLNLLGILAVLLTFRKIVYADRLIAGVLAFLWLWIGIAYHYAFFTAVNPAAWGFAALNILQGFVFLWYGVLSRRLTFRYHPNAFGMIGLLLILYALILYPLLGSSLGHVYPKSPTFGLPCPTTIFTFGMLLLADAKVPKPVMIIPLIWSFVGFMAAVKLGVLEDVGLVVSGIVAGMMIFYRDKRFDGIPQMPER